MKKTIGLLSIALLPTISFNAYAESFAGAATVGTNTCALFSEDLKLNPSANVVGGWNCDTAGTFQTDKGAQFVVATCHTAGRQGSRTSVTGTGTATGTATVTGSLVYRAGTGGGSMDQVFPGDACDAALAQGQVE